MLGWLLEEIFAGRDGGLPPMGCMIPVALFVGTVGLIFTTPMAIGAVLGFLGHFR